MLIHTQHKLGLIGELVDKLKCDPAKTNELLKSYVLFYSIRISWRNAKEVIP